MIQIQRPRLSSLLLLVLLVVITLDQGSCDTFYIITSPGNYCPDQYLTPDHNQSSCLTLSEFVSLQTNSSQLQDPETLLLILEPGNHTLSSPLSVPTNISSFTVLAANSSSSVTVHCASNSGLQISTVDHVLIEGVDLVGCEANEVEFVTNFTLQDFIFYRSTLSLENVQNVSIARGLFSSNSFVNTTLYIYRSGTLYLKETNFVNNRGNIVGALRIIDTDATLDQCTFLNNSVQNFQYLPNSYYNCGGAIYANATPEFTSQKRLTITGCNFTANEATDGSYATRVNGYNGGAICSQYYASLIVSNSSFERNMARSNGGAVSVISGFRGLIHIDRTQFSQNSLSYLWRDPEADGSGGVYIDGSAAQVKIAQCVFTGNTGGVKVVGSPSVLNYTENEFTDNRGRAVFVTQRTVSQATLVAIDRCNFTGNFDRRFNSFYNPQPGGGAVTIQAMHVFPNHYTYTVQINGSTFSNNYANYSGGALKIFTAGSEDSNVTVQIYNTTFTNNICNNYYRGQSDRYRFCQGGAMNVNITGSKSFVDVTQSVFVDNKSKGDRSNGGALALNAERIAINQSVFSHNEANIGGALYIDKVSELLISESTFLENIIPVPKYNWIETSAGVIFVSTHTNSTVIERSVFLNNSASKCGVMDFNREAYRGFFFVSNSFNPVSISDSYFENNQATQNEGGVFCFTRGEVTVSNSTFISNSANTNGGVISAVNTHLNMTASTFNQNTAGMDGGALYGSGDYNVSGSFFLENRAAGNGGAVCLDQGDQARMSGSLFISNHASSGGALSVAGFRLELEDIVAFNNTAEVNGDVMISCKSAAVLPEDLENLLFIQVDPNYYNDDSYCIFYNEQFRDLQNSTNGTDIEYVKDAQQYISSSADSQNGTLILDSLQQYADRDPQIVILNLELELIDPGQTYNLTLNSSDLHFRYLETLDIVGNGGTIVCTAYHKHVIAIHTIISANISDVTFDGCEFRFGSVTNLMLHNVTFLGQSILRLDSLVSATISNSHFTGRSGCCNYWPSHYIIADNVQQLLVTSSSFLNNWGGCIYSDDVHLTVEHSNFTDNINYPTNKAWGKGGAITALHFYLPDHTPGSTSLHIANSTFTGNSAGYGGAVYVRGPDTPVSISQCTFTDNRATLQTGGGVDIHTESSVVISESTFNSNYAEYDGGAVYSESTSLSIERSNFTDNAVRFNFGGAVLALVSSLSINGSRFTGNAAASRGGAIYLVNTHSDHLVSIDQSSFINNTLSCRRVLGTRGYYTTCGDNGAALYLRVGEENSVVISHSEFLGNTADNGIVTSKQDIIITGTEHISYINTTSDRSVLTTEGPTVPETTTESSETTVPPSTYPPTPDVIATTVSESSSSQPTTSIPTIVKITTETVTTSSPTTSTVGSETTTGGVHISTLPSVATTTSISTVTMPTFPNGRGSTTQSPTTAHSVPTQGLGNETTSAPSTPSAVPAHTDAVSSSTSSEQSSSPSETTSTSMSLIRHETTTESEPHQSSTTGVTVDQGRRKLVQKIVIPVGVVASVLLVAVLISVAVIVVCFIRRRRTGRSYGILTDSNVEMLESESPENSRKLHGDDHDEEL